MDFIVRVLLGLGAGVTGWFVDANSPNFGVVQGMLSIAVLAVIVFAVAFWPKRWK